MPDPNETPTEVSIPSAKGIVGVAGKQPLPIYLDLDRNGIADWQEKKFRRPVADFLYWVLALIFPRATQTTVVKAAAAQLDQFIEETSK